MQDSVSVHTKIRPKDVPGTLLNVALLNLGSSDPSLRSAAYNLLCSLTQTFELRIESQLLETAGASGGGESQLLETAGASEGCTGGAWRGVWRFRLATLL